MTVQGTVGETLTFSDLLVDRGTVGSYGNVGIEAVTVEAIPEPATDALMLAGMLLLGLGYRRFGRPSRA